MAQQLRQKAKALRARYGVAGGVRPAKNGETCKTEYECKPFVKVCGQRAHVISASVPQCREHMKIAHKPRRRRHLGPTTGSTTKPEIKDQHTFPADENAKLHKTSAAIAADALRVVRVRRET